MTKLDTKKYRILSLPSGLLVLLFVAFIIRLYQLNAGLWYDEILTLVKYARLPFIEILTTFDSENQHSLYSLLAHASILLFGEHGWSLRLPAVVFGVGSIWAVFHMGRQVTSEIEAFLAACLLAFSYHHVWFSQNARGYTGLLFWTLISSCFFLRSLINPCHKNWIFYALTSSLGVYTHLTMGFVIIGQFIVYFLTNGINYLRKKTAHLNGIFWGFVLSAILILFMYFPVINQMKAVIGGTEVSVVSEWKSPVWTVMEILNGLSISFTFGIAGLLFLAIAVLGLLSYWKSFPEFIGLVILPPIIGTIVTIVIGHHLWPRFFFFIYGFAVLIIIRGMMVTGNWFLYWIRSPKISAKWFGIGLSSVLIVLSAISMPFAYGPKQDFEGALDYIEKNTLSTDQIVVLNLSAIPYRDYYLKDWLEVKSGQELEQVLTNAGRTWLVYTFPEVLASVHPDIQSIIEKEFILVNEFPGTVNSGTIYLVLSK